MVIFLLEVHNYSCTLGESKILRQRLLEKFVPGKMEALLLLKLKTRRGGRLKELKLLMLYLMRMFMLKMLKRILVMLRDRT